MAILYNILIIFYIIIPLKIIIYYECKNNLIKFYHLKKLGKFLSF
jgi:hypothetical protein